MPPLAGKHARARGVVSFIAISFIVPRDESKMRIMMNVRSARRWISSQRNWICPANKRSTMATRFPEEESFALKTILPRRPLPSRARARSRGESRSRDPRGPVVVASRRA